MKKVLFLVMGLMLVMFVGCATVQSPTGFAAVNSITAPVGATGNTSATTKVGKATCRNVLGLVASGDCSIEAAKKQGNIKEVVSVDYEASSFITFFSSYTTVVRGN